MSTIIFDKTKGPVITIITVVFNCVDFIEQTIKSVTEQIYPNIEYIIIDGGSTDGTVEIIKKYNEKISKWVSESDKGIYDAMNKGIELASGGWINFLNAGDTFCSNDVLEKIFFDKKITVDLIYGNSVAIEKSGRLVHYLADDNLNKLWQRAKFGHESLFAKSDIIKKNKFDLRYKIAADYNFILGCYYLGYSFFNSKIDILKYVPPVFSENHRWQSSFETWKIARAYNPSLKVDLFYLKSFLSGLLVVFFKKFIPNRIYNFLRMVKNAI